MRNVLRLAIFWPRLVAEMIGTTIKGMPLTIEKQHRQIETQAKRIAFLERELTTTRFELARRQPGGFRAGIENQN